MNFKCFLYFLMFDMSLKRMNLAALGSVKVRQFFAENLLQEVRAANFVASNCLHDKLVEVRWH